MIEILSEENRAASNTGRNPEVRGELSLRRRNSRKASGSNTTQAITTSITRTITSTATTKRLTSTTITMATTLRNITVTLQTFEGSIVLTREETLLIFVDLTVTIRSILTRLLSRTTPSSKRSSTTDPRELSRESKTRAIRKTRQSLQLCQLSNSKGALTGKDRATEI